MFGETVWLGVRRGGRLVSMGVATLSDAGSHVMFVATDAAFRNRGFATSVVSELTRRILEKSDFASIYVIDGNLAAAKTYSKVGYHFYKQYLFLRT